MGERIDRATESIKRNAKRFTALAAIGGVSLLAAGCGSNETHSLKDAKQIANERYQRVYDESSPVGKFALQYLRRAFVDVSAARDDGDGGGGITSLYRFQFNDGCLGGSAYDVAGGDFHIRVSASGAGLFSSAEANGSVNGRVPAAAANAYVDNRHPDVLRIQSGHDSTPPLIFDGVDGTDGLDPVTQYTENVLSTYGCSEGPAGYSTLNGDFLTVHAQLFLK